MHHRSVRYVSAVSVLLITVDLLVTGQDSAGEKARAAH